MNTQKFIIATIVGAVASMIAGFLVYGLALKNYMTDNSMEGTMVDQPNWLYLIIANLIFAALLTYVFMKWATISTWMGGLKAGATLGLLFSLGSAFLWFATSNLYTGGIAPVIVDGIAGMVIWSVGGMAVGGMLGMGKKE